MKKTRQITVTAVFTALYFVLSAMLKIPVAGHITLDMGYIALMVGAVQLGAIPATVIGAVGVFLESALMSQRGVSVGWMLMNAIVGYSCGLVLHRAVEGGKKRLLTAACIVVPISMLAGVTVKTLIDCVMYDLPLLAKIPTGIAAWIADSAVMLGLGLPLSLAVRKRLK